MTLKNPVLSNSIAVDIPKLNEILDSLSKANPTDVDGISTGAMRIYEVSSGKWQWQEFNGSSWAPVPFLQHNVDQLDGYHAAITPAANTVAVRNASGLLQDSITGNAATASSAATLSETLPVNKGGTGATTSEAARTNLGVPPTSHVSTATTYGVGNSTQYGHLKLSDATDSASNFSGGVASTPAAVKAAKDAAEAAMTKASTAAADITAVSYNVNALTTNFNALTTDVNALTTNFNAFVANVNSLATVAERVNSSGDNWIRYESGIQLCWGDGVTNASGGVTITLHVPYTNNLFSVSPATAGNSGSLSAQIALYVERNSSTSFTVWAATGGKLAPGVGFSYFTIGRWK